jgi:hypothetical protein
MTRSGSEQNMKAPAKAEAFQLEVREAPQAASSRSSSSS